MNAPTKATGAAAGIALAIVLTFSWVLDLYGIKLPPDLSAAWQGALTFGLAYLIHDNPP